MKTYRNALLSAAALAALGFTGQAHAQTQTTAASQGSELEAVVVTAQRREESLQEVPLSVTAIGSEQIERSHPQNLSDFTRSAPNFTIEAVGSISRSSAVIYSRGIGFSSVDVVEPPVGVSIDGLFYAVNTGALHNTFDVKRIEILQGPQGTLFGRNTTGGVVQIVTNDPGTEFGGSGFVRVGSHGRLNTFLAVDLPISDTLSARIATSTQYSDGAYINRYVDPASGQSTADKRTGGDNTKAIRGKLLWTPSEEARVLLTGWYTRQRQDSPVGQNASGPGDRLFTRGVINANSPVVGRPGLYYPGGPQTPFVVRRDLNGADNLTTWGAVLDGQLETPYGFDVVSITGYYDYKSRQITDFDGTDLNFFHTAGGGQRWQFSQEVRLQSNDTDSPLSWQAGLFYFKTQYQSSQVNIVGPTFLAQTAATTPVTNQFVASEIHNYSIAGFAQADYEVTPQLVITFGGRLIHEKKEIWVHPALPNLIKPYANTLTNNETWDDFIFRLAARYEVNDDLMFYASYSTGTKAGGFSTGATTQSQLDPYKPEKAKAWEAGMRSDWLENRLRVNATVFWNEYDDLQVGAFRPVAGGTGQQSFTANAAFERARGVELQVTALPIRNMTLSAAIGYLDARYTSFKAALSYAFPGRVCNGTVGGVPIIQDHSDPKDPCFLVPARAPAWTAKLDGSYKFDLGDLGTITPHVVWSHESSHYTNLTNAPQGYQPTYSKWDADIAYEHPSSNWRLSLYGKNITNKTHLYNANPIAGLFTVNYYQSPRTWGVELGVNF